LSHPAGIIELMFDILSKAIDELGVTDLDALSDVELHQLVVELQRQSTRLAAVCTRAIGAWDARKVWALNGSKSPAARLARETRCAPGSAHATVRRARQLRGMSHTAAAFADGDLPVDQVDLLCRANQPRVADQFADSEEHLVQSATRLGYRDLLRVVRYWQQHADPDGADQRAKRAHHGRELYATRTFAGSIDLRGRLDPISGTFFLNELERLERQLFEADWAEARARVGETVTADELARTPTQRRHDALIDMARRSAAKPQDAAPARPLITVLVGYETFAGSICEMADGTVIPPSSMLGLLDEADIERIVFDGPSRPIDLGQRTRFFSAAQRRVVEVRDRHCQHPSGCDVPAEKCQVDHIVEYTDGGATSIENARLLCPVHNRRRPGRRAPPNPEAA
jgi:hypothetical protein